METNKTTLQIVKEQIEQKMCRAIEQAIEAGAQINYSSKGATIDGVYVIKQVVNEGHAVVLYFQSAELDDIFKPTAKDLAERAEQLRAELEQIENQMKEDKQ